MKPVKCHRKYPITTNFLDTMLEHSVVIEDGESKLDAYRRGLRELDKIAAELRKEASQSQEEQYPQPFPNPNRFDRMTDLKKPSEVTYQNGSIPIISKDREPEDKVLSMLDAIRSCKEKKVLETYRLLVKTDIQLQNCYNAKLEDLSK